MKQILRLQFNFLNYEIKFGCSLYIKKIISFLTKSWKFHQSYNYLILVRISKSVFFTWKKVQKNTLVFPLNNNKHFDKTGLCSLSLGPFFHQSSKIVSDDWLVYNGLNYIWGTITKLIHEKNENLSYSNKRK